VHVEGLAGDFYVEGEADTCRHRAVFEHLRLTLRDMRDLCDLYGVVAAALRIA